ncbi:hypothetical protein BH09BAC4_BH09BAC4_07300 [soil metagenome]
MGLVVFGGRVFFGEGVAMAQEDGYYSKAIDNDKGYWKLKTDMNRHGTQIRFYSADSQLVYQESLPNQFIELTPRNIRRLDQALARLLDNQLIVSTVPTSELPVDKQKRFVKKAERKAVKPNPIRQHQPAELDFQVQLFTPTGIPAVHLVLTNPTLERLVISIRSVDNTVEYEHITHLGDSRHHLDFTGMPVGSYQIWVKSSTQQYQQPVTLSYGQHEARVQMNGKEPLRVVEPLISRK